jgi:protein phosphatase
VGDSRAYLWRRRTLRRLTKDHSFAENLRSEQGLTDTEIRAHPGRHVVTQTLGLGTPAPSVVETPLQSADWILLCSDGLTDELTDPAITKVLESADSVEEAADSLIEAALNHGGRDNVSVVVVGYNDQDRRARAARPTAVKLLLSIASGIGVALICAAAYWWYRS